MAEDNPDLERISGAEPLPASLAPARAREQRAWQPITPRGVAAFARAKSIRLLTVCLLVALRSSGVVVWFVAAAWAPVATEAIRHLPDTGQIENGQLSTPRLSPEPLATNPFLGLGVDIGARANANVGTDLYVRFDRARVSVCAFLGCAAIQYPNGWTIQFNRPQLEPWWGAWKPMLWCFLFAGTTTLLFICWLLLGIIYTPATWWIGRRRGKKLAWKEAWRLATACNLPGACLFALGILAYYLGPLGLISLCIVAVAHLVPAWVYIAICPALAPDRPRPLAPHAGQRGNPFGGGKKKNVAGGKNVFGPNA